MVAREYQQPIKADADLPRARPKRSAPANNPPDETAGPDTLDGQASGGAGRDNHARSAVLAIGNIGLSARLGVELTKLGLRVISVNSGQAILQIAEVDRPALLVVEDQLEDGDAVDFCEALTQKHGTLAVVVADEAQPERIVRALRRGVDDYVTGVEDDDSVLIARVQALVGRRSAAPQPAEDAHDGERAIIVGRITIRPWAFNVLVDGQRVDLTVTQFRLLLLLAKKPGHIVRPEQITQYLAERGSSLRQSSVKSHIYFLRQKLGAAGNQIENVRRVGYRLSEF